MEVLDGKPNFTNLGRQNSRILSLVLNLVISWKGKTDITRGSRFHVFEQKIFYPGWNLKILTIFDIKKP